MKKRIIALVLCVFMLIPFISSCSKTVVESYLQVYLAHQVYDLDPLNAYTNDAQLKIVNLIFAGLYKLDDNGKVKSDLVKKAEIINKEDKEEYTLRLTLEETCWSNGSQVSAEDVVYTIKRVLKAQKTNDATAMLMKIKNAKAVKNGEESLDNLGIYAPSTNVVEIEFDEFITDEMFDEIKLAFTSTALFPLNENYVEGKEDWAKKPATMICSGPFIVRKVSYEDGKKQLILERNAYYFRNREKDAEDKYVTPYRIVIDYEYTAEDQVTMYENGQVLFVGEIPLSLRAKYASEAEITDTLSTHTYYFNQNAVVYTKSYTDSLTKYFNDFAKYTDTYKTTTSAWNSWKSQNSNSVTLELPTLPVAPSLVLSSYNDAELADFISAIEKFAADVELFKAAYLNKYLDIPDNAVPGKVEILKVDAKQIKLFAIPEVRKALSISVDREAIANAVVLAEAATGFVPKKAFNGLNAKTTFRDAGKDLIATTANTAEATNLLATAGINASDYSFTIRYRECDEIHALIAQTVATAWSGLGFTVTAEPVGVVVNDELDPSTNEEVTDIKDDLFNEEVVTKGQFQVMAVDFVAKSPDAFSVLAPFAIDYTGNLTVSGKITQKTPHFTGYNSAEYNELINKAYNAETIEERANYLHEAEQLLVAEDFVVMPIIFNQSAVLVPKQVKGLTSSYYGIWNFTKAKFSKWATYREEYFPETTEGSDEEEAEPIE